MSKKCGCKIHIHTNHPLQSCNQQMCPIRDWIEYCPLHAHAGELRSIIDDINYTLTNVWAPDYKKFFELFKTRMEVALAKSKPGESK